MSLDDFDTFYWRLRWEPLVFIVSVPRDISMVVVVSLPGFSVTMLTNRWWVITVLHSVKLYWEGG